MAVMASTFLNSASRRCWLFAHAALARFSDVRVAKSLAKASKKRTKAPATPIVPKRGSIMNMAMMKMMIPLGRCGTPEEAAGAISLFCFPESDYISGQLIE